MVSAGSPRPSRTSGTRSGQHGCGRNLCHVPLASEHLRGADVTHSAVAPLSRDVFNALQIESIYPHEYWWARYNDSSYSRKFVYFAEFYRHNQTQKPTKENYGKDFRNNRQPRSLPSYDRQEMFRENLRIFHWWLTRMMLTIGRY